MLTAEDLATLSALGPGSETEVTVNGTDLFVSVTPVATGTPDLFDVTVEIIGDPDSGVAQMANYFRITQSIIALVSECLDM